MEFAIITRDLILEFALLYWRIVIGVADTYGWWTYPVTVAIIPVLAGFAFFKTPIWKVLFLIAPVWIFIFLVDLSSGSKEERDSAPKAIEVKE